MAGGHGFASHGGITLSRGWLCQRYKGSKIPVSEKSHSSFLPPKQVNSIFLDAVNEQEIIEICTTCRSGTAVGYDDISMDLIKESIDTIISPLTCIINLSITSGIVLKQLKIARVIPLFKSGEQDIFTNY